MGCACVKIAHTGLARTSKISLFKQLIGTPPTKPYRFGCMASPIVQALKRANNKLAVDPVLGSVPTHSALPIVVDRAPVF